MGQNIKLQTLLHIFTIDRFYRFTK